MPVHLQRAVGLLALATGLCAPTAALAGQDAPSASAGTDTAAKDANVFTPDFFARFAPQTAYDMLLVRRPCCHIMLQCVKWHSCSSWTSAVFLRIAALDRRLVAFAGANAQHGFDRHDEDLAVADAAGLRGLRDRLDHTLG